jgi:hypothetical protein
MILTCYIISPVGRGTVSQDGRLRVRFPVGPFEIFKRPIPSVRVYSPWGPLSLQQKWLPRNSFGGKVRPARRADNCALLVVPNVKVWKLNIMTCYRKALPSHYLTPTQVYAIRNHCFPRNYYGNHYLSINILTCTYKVQWIRKVYDQTRLNFIVYWNVLFLSQATCFSSYTEPSLGLYQETWNTIVWYNQPIYIFIRLDNNHFTLSYLI